eukprot:scaffold13986_cov58-Cyclotella_meneghiniana.AAC.2
MNEAVQALHPPRSTASRRRIIRRSSSQNSSSNGSNFPSTHHSHSSQRHASSPSTIRTKQNSKPRFTELLLEHGETQLIDYAVLASSSTSSSSGLLRNTEGRLRVCTRSIVLEPRNSCRGIVRVPFRFMTNCPSLTMQYDRSNSGGKNESSVLSVSTNRYFIMKANNAIGPYDQIQKSTEITLQFLHSSPSTVETLLRELYSVEKKSMVRFNTSSEKEIGNIETVLTTPMMMHPDSSDNGIKMLITSTADEIMPSLESFHFLHVHEHPLSSTMKCSLKEPLLHQDGVAVLTNYGLYFQPMNGMTSFSVVSNNSTNASKPHTFLSVNDVVAIARRYDGLQDVAVELYLAKRHGRHDDYNNCKSYYQSILLSFESYSVRENVLRTLLSQRNNNHEEAPPIPCFTDASFVESAMQQWQNGQIDNFSYLLILNAAAGRSYHDVSRYPVFPWVLSNYGQEDDMDGETAFLDLNNPSNYRDLSKPIGALNEERFVEFRKRYEGMVQQQREAMERGQVHPDACTAATDRLFHSIHSTYQSILNNPADVKELIPEFYDPDCFDFLINAMGLQLGNLQSTGERVNDVILPSWAKSAKHFLKMNRAALESPYCTEQLPKWIDLIFGVTSRGMRAKEARNLFHPISYLTPSVLEAMHSEEEKKTVELQANEFGICPDQLFCKEHPKKNASWESVEGVVMSNFRKV